MAKIKLFENIFDELKRLFNTDIIVRKLPSGKLKIIDIDNIQTMGITATNYLNTGLGGLYSSNRSVNKFGYNQSISIFSQRLVLFRDYELMEQDPIISAGLDAFSEETTTRNEFGDILRINCDNQKIKSLLENLYYDILNIEFNLPHWIRNLVKYGDWFMKLNIAEKYGIVSVLPLSVYYVSRIEGEDPKKPNSYSYKVDIPGLKGDFENYEISHMRLLTDSNYLPYGKSMIESARRIWKQLSLMEDAMLIHRIMRAPQKRIFKIDIGNLAPNEVDAYMQKIMNGIKKVPYIDSSTGDYNLKYNMENIIEDFYMPVRGGDSGTSIDTLSGLEYNPIEDIEYLRNKLMAALRIPKAFLGYEESLGSKCLHPHTKIAISTGKSKTIKEIAEDFENNKIDYKVYTYDFDNDKKILTDIKCAELTRKNAELVSVKLDNNKNIICTPDHKFVLDNGLEVKAHHLTFGDKLKSDNNEILVMFVEFLNDKINTYNLEVDNDNHNFLLDVGIYVKNSTLASEDIRFARTIEKIQRIVEAELTRLGILHLFAQGITDESLVNFDVKLTHPSIVYEQEKLEMWKSKIDLSNDIKDGKLLSTNWIYKHIFNISDSDKKQERADIIDDIKRNLRHTQIEEQGNDPLETGEIKDDNDDNNKQVVQDKPGHPEEPLKTKLGTDDHYLGRDPNGNKTNKQNPLDKTSGLDFKGKSPLAINKETIELLRTYTKKNKLTKKIKILGETVELYSGKLKDIT